PRTPGVALYSWGVSLAVMARCGLATQRQAAFQTQPALLGRPRLQCPAEAFDDAATHGQTQAQAFRLAGVKRSEHLRQNLGPGARALIAHADADLIGRAAGAQPNTG